MQVKDWHVNVAIALAACGAFTIGAKFAAMTTVEQGIKMEDTTSYTLIQQPLTQLKQGIISRDVKAISDMVKGNGFDMEKDDYKLFLDQFKTQGDVTLFINVLENQASTFVKGGDLSKDYYYYLDGDVENLILRVNKVNVNARFGTSETVNVNGEDFGSGTKRTAALPSTLPFNTKYTATVGNKWKDVKQLNLFDMFIEKEVKNGSKLDTNIKFFENGAGLLVHINTNCDGAVLYVNNEKTNRTVSAGGCFRDGFSEGDTIRLEFGGKRTKEFTVKANRLSATLNLDLGEYLAPTEIKKPVGQDADFIVDRFLNAISQSIRAGKTEYVEELMADGSGGVAQSVMQTLFMQYKELNFKNTYVNNTVTSSDGGVNATATFTYDGTDINGNSLQQPGTASIQINSEGDIIGFTLQ